MPDKGLDRDGCSRGCAGSHEARAGPRRPVRKTETGMDKKGKPFQIAILLYPGVTALDAVGPWEALSRIPDTEVRFVGKETGPVMTEGGVLLLGVTHTMTETPSPDLVLIPGGTSTPSQMVDDGVLDWLRHVHKTSIWTASV